MIIHEPLGHVGDNYVSTTQETRALHVGMRDGRLTVWLDQPDMDGRTPECLFWVSMTGQEAPNGFPYHIGTVQDDRWVWHVFSCRDVQTVPVPL